VVYNEIDPFAAEWLENLISAGELPQGAVERRSIRELKGIDCGPTTHLFAGIGGWPIALRLAGWPVEWPVWTGSCPCQPYSAAGKGKGDADERNLWPEMFRLIRECRPNTIFGEQVEGAVGHGWLDGISADLEGEGYAVGAVVLGAHSVGAPHIRQRLFWVADWGKRERCVPEPPRSPGFINGLADSDESRRERPDGASESREITGERPRKVDTCGGRRELGRLAHSECIGIRLPGHGADRETPAGMQGSDGKRKRVRFDFGSGREITDPGILRIFAECGYWPGCERTREGHHAANCPGRIWGNDPGYWSGVRERLANANQSQLCGQSRAGEQSEHEQDGGISGLEHAESDGREQWGAESSGRGVSSGFGVNRLDDADTQRCDRQRIRILERGPHEAGLEIAGAGSIDRPWDDYRIIHCKDGKSRRVGRSVQPLAHGIPVQLRPLFAWLGRLGIDASPLTKMARLARRNRTGRLKGYGNAINPFVAAEFVRAFMEIAQ